ncbi:TetR family transcriptional regulator [Microbacterium sp. E-13]|uniref:TetR family transcriptional regulator n=1 Tax=Microbacterium sp. E-13 TaxID=3404048 RepID=UPI003CEBE239
MSSDQQIPPAVDQPAPRPGLRQRQREALESELRQIALRLFEERGFDEVTISEIAAEAGVSERTFSRYFPSKEEVVLGILESFGPVIRGRASQEPFEGSWFDVLRRTYDLREAEGASFADITRVVRLTIVSPRLLAGMLARRRNSIADIADIIGERLGVDPAVDPRPGVWATLVISIAQAESMRKVAAGGELDGSEFLDALDTLPEFMGMARE